MVKSSQKYYSMRFWDELFKSKGFKSLGYGPNTYYTGMAHIYQATALAGRFLILMDDWYFRGSNSPQFTLIWNYSQKSGSMTKLTWAFSYPAVWEFRLLLNALQDPQLMPICAGMNWCSEIWTNSSLPEPEIISA